MGKDYNPRRAFSSREDMTQFATNIAELVVKNIKFLTANGHNELALERAENLLELTANLHFGLDGFYDQEALEAVKNIQNTISDKIGSHRTTYKNEDECSRSL